MDPDEATTSAWRTLGDVADWLRIPPTDGSGVCERGSLRTLLGAADADHWRVVSMMRAGDYRALLQRWRIGGQTARTPAQLAQAGMLGRCCWLAGGLALDRAASRCCGKLAGLAVSDGA